MKDNKKQELQMKLKKGYITMLLTIGCLTVTCSGCGTNDTKDNNVQVLNVDTETLQETEQTETEEAKEFVEANTEMEEVATLEQYIGNWVRYYSDTSWIDISLYYVDDELCATVTEYHNDDVENPYFYQDYVYVPVENNTITKEYDFSYKLIPQDDDSLKVIMTYPDSEEFEGKAPEEYILEKASDETLELEKNIETTFLGKQYDMKLAEVEAAQDSTVSDEEETSETEETEEEKYSDEELITAALGCLDTALADSIKRTRTTYEVDSVTDVKRGSSGHYSVRFYILFDGHTYEYFTVKLWDFEGLQYNGHE